MSTRRPALALLAFALVYTALPAQSTQSHIRAVESGLGPVVTIVGRPVDHREILAEMQRLHVPAVSIAVIHGGKIEWAKGYGTQSESGAPVTTGTLFQAASLSKSLTSMAALRLVEQRKLSLDAPVETELKSWILPQTSFAAQSPVTLRKLLSHTAGTTVHGFRGYAAGEPVPTLTQVLNGTKPANSDPVVVAEVPGTHYSYSGGGYSIVQQMMIDQSGKAFPQLMKESVLGPVGMSSSTFQQPLDPAKRNKVAMPVDSQGKPIPGGPHTYPEMAAAGLWTTPSDVARWVIELQRSLTGKANHVISAEMARTMLTPIKEGYGLGVGAESPSHKPAMSHGGGNEGYRCIYFAYQDGDGAVIMTNSENGGALYGELLGSIARVYGWPDYRPQERTLATVPLAQQLQFTGNFQIKDGPAMAITPAKDSLQLSMYGSAPNSLFPSSPASFFVTDDIMQLTFDGPDHGVVIFGERRDPFERVKDAAKP
ncbi:serine hydrolase domain-containing protein [Terriglobus roseus]|nr:serine hydrolase domain-containing protein [Terriglobus roseus]